MTVRIIEGDALAVLRSLPSESVQCVVTSPPYFQLRDYGVDGQIGLEPTPAEFIAALLAVFDEVKRVLRPDGTCWVNLGDSYAGSGKGPSASLNKNNDHSHAAGEAMKFNGRNAGFNERWGNSPGAKRQEVSRPADQRGSVAGIPAKNLLLMPERFAIAMQDAGWYVRSRIAWCKTSAMPESVRDRPTSAWEHIWMFSRSRTYFYDAEAVKQPNTALTGSRHSGPSEAPNRDRYSFGIPGQAPHCGSLNVNGGGAHGANLRNYWLLGPEPSKLEHFAAYPPEIPRRCILAGTSQAGACPSCGAGWVRAGRDAAGQGNHAPGGGPKAIASQIARENGGIGRLDGGRRSAESSTFNNNPNKRPARPASDHWTPSCTCPPSEPVPQVVLDPFLGSGTTALVADRLGRDAIGVELSPTYAAMARRRIESDEQMFSAPVVVEQAPRQADLFEAVS